MKPDKLGLLEAGDDFKRVDDAAQAREVGHLNKSIGE